ncbi:hypothetical protein GB931_00210 [Modestobacter sp. I12A-02628]|uniref:Uncharacterized protein n=1 Tax=Goekera deserti TaxID=2497753 RepID=A0A7K3WI29_9ACTN|nr:hypothetical protein [Goekera deserti]MPQ96370.1 hypothetical protein [Goekera deserti]NDI50538.1 hypothetical protein [Goekera deserti]NEL56148.1 hypothetical protein [Goekera deserti]
MSEHEQIDDPGADPAGLDPPRNIFSGGGGGGADQDTGQGRPRGNGNVGPGDAPEDPTDPPTIGDGHRDD